MMSMACRNGGGSGVAASRGPGGGRPFRLLAEAYLMTGHRGVSLWHVAATVVAAALILGAGGLRAAAQEADSAALDKAVAALRNIDPAAMSDEQKQAKAEAVSEAWQVLLGAGKAGAARLKTEIQALDQAKETDAFFRLGAASLLWQIGSLDEAPTIAAQWRAAPQTVNYNYVFFVAFEAAKTQDKRALDMLKACLNEDKGSVFIPDHFLTIDWPLGPQCLWGAFGPKGIPVLLDVLKTSDKPVELKTAAILLTRAQATEALPILRAKLLKHADAEVRRIAVRCLGLFGHPDDFDVLVAGLKSQDPQDVWHHLFALYEYEDLRAVPHVAPLLESADENVRSEAFAVLTHLKTPAGLEAIRRHGDKATSDQEKQAAKEFVGEVLAGAGITWDQYEAKSAAERDAVMAAARARDSERYAAKADDRKLTREDLAKAAKGWKDAHRITGGEFEWVEDRHIVAVATPDDLDLLREVEGALYWRLSDECLYEVQIINNLIRRIGRSRYRAEPGLAEKVTAPTPKAP